MTWRCSACHSNNVSPRSLTRDYRCLKCGHVMSDALKSKPGGYNPNGRPPKFLRVKA